MSALADHGSPGGLRQDLTARDEVAFRLSDRVRERWTLGREHQGWGHPDGSPRRESEPQSQPPRPTQHPSHLLSSLHPLLVGLCPAGFGVSRDCCVGVTGAPACEAVVSRETAREACGWGQRQMRPVHLHWHAPVPGALPSVPQAPRPHPTGAETLVGHPAQGWAASVWCSRVQTPHLRLPAAFSPLPLLSLEAVPVRHVAHLKGVHAATSRSARSRHWAHPARSGLGSEPALPPVLSGWQPISHPGVLCSHPSAQRSGPEAPGCSRTWFREVCSAVLGQHGCHQRPEDSVPSGLHSGDPPQPGNLPFSAPP